MQQESAGAKFGAPAAAELLASAEGCGEAVYSALVLGFSQNSPQHQEWPLFSHHTAQGEASGHVSSYGKI